MNTLISRNEMVWMVGKKWANFRNFQSVLKKDYTFREMVLFYKSHFCLISPASFQGPITLA